MDRVLTCVTCRQPFSFTQKEQNFFAERQLVQPTHCTTCRKSFLSVLLQESAPEAVKQAQRILSQAKLSESVLIQAVVTKGPRYAHGDSIIAVTPAWHAIAKLLEKAPNVLFDIDPFKLEEIIAGAYEAAGFDEVILTPRSGDFGRDVIAIKHGFLTIRIIDQVKAFGRGRLVPANDVRALLGVLQADQKATKGLVTTTSDFAPMIKKDPFIAPFIPERLELVNGKDLVSRLIAISNGESLW